MIIAVGGAGATPKLDANNSSLIQTKGNSYVIGQKLAGEQGVHRAGSREERERGSCKTSPQGRGAVELRS